jgi:dipeptidyl aminopeptidase/acylaminoacyl peptidase
VASDCAGAYLASGWLLFVRQGTLVAQRLDVNAGALTGEPVTVADPIAVDQSVNVCALSASNVGPMTYRAGGTDKHQLQWFDRAGKPLGTLNVPDDAGLLDPELSPDGRRVVADRTVQGNTDIWLIDGARTSRLTFDAATDHWPIWSPDGKWIAFDSTRKGSHDLYMKPANGEADEQLLLADAEGKGVMDWSPDGRSLMYTSQGPGTAFDLWVLDMKGDRKPQPFLKTRFDETNGQFSPDGRWVAYQSNESGQYQIYVRPFPGPGGQWQISTAGGVAPRWRHDGRELYYIAPDGRLIATPVEARSATVEPGAPVPLFQTRIVSSALRPQFDVAADGRFLLNAPVESAAVAPITLVINWRPPMK